MVESNCALWETEYQGSKVDRAVSTNLGGLEGIFTYFDENCDWNSGYWEYYPESA